MSDISKSTVKYKVIYYPALFQIYFVKLRDICFAFRAITADIPSINL